MILKPLVNPVDFNEIYKFAGRWSAAPFMTTKESRYMREMFFLQVGRNRDIHKR